MAVDKEALKKHHFWFMMVPVVIGLLVAWFGLLSEVPGATQEKQEANDKSEKALAAIKAQPKNLKDLYDAQARTLRVQREKMWKEAWNEQKDLFVWPKGYSEKQLADVKGLKFGKDNISKVNSTLQQFRDPGIYHAEYENLIKELEPMTFRGDDWKTVLSYIPHQWPRTANSEDAWLALEDLWVQRDILHAINKVNRDAARFEMVKETDKDGKPVKDNPRHRKLKSRFWELDLELVDKGAEQWLQGTLKNISPRLQVTGINNSMILNVRFSKDDKRDFPCIVEGTSAEVNQSLEIKPIKKKGEGDLNIVPPGWSNDPSKMEIYSVEQEFDLRTVPVKRIEAFVFGKASLSDRNHGLTLRMSRFSDAAYKKEAAAAPISAGGDKPTGGPPAATGPNAAGAEVSVGSKSQNGLERNRYLDVTDQVRRMPFAVAVVTDQMFMKDILENIANSKLRFQTTQVDLARFHGTLHYYSEKPAGGPAGVAMAPAEPPANPGGVAAPAVPFPRINFGPKPVPGPGIENRYGAAPVNNREDQFSANLLVLSVYGILSIYEQFDESKALPKQPETPKGKQPETPKGKQPETPKGKQPETPKGKQPETPKGKQPETPKGKQPETPKGKQPDSAKEKQPETPKGKQPDTPKEKQPETPKGKQPDSPKEKQPDTPKEKQPETPKGKQPETPKEKQPETPMNPAPKK